MNKISGTKKGVEYECRKRHADKRPRDEFGKFLNKDAS
jgi:hypothetical protein